MIKDQIISNIKGIQSQLDSMLCALDESEKYMTSKEACQLLEISPATLSKLAGKYKLKDSKIKGHRAYLKESVLKLAKIKKDNQIVYK